MPQLLFKVRSIGKKWGAIRQFCKPSFQKKKSARPSKNGSNKCRSGGFKPWTSRVRALMEASNNHTPPSTPNLSIYAINFNPMFLKVFFLGRNAIKALAVYPRIISFNPKILWKANPFSSHSHLIDYVAIFRRFSFFPIKKESCRVMIKEKRIIILLPHKNP